MTVYNSNFKILYHFENEDISILEIKRNGITSDDKSKIYHWVIYDKGNDLLQPLLFESKDRHNEKEIRRFDGFSLQFSPEKAVLIEENNRSQNVLKTVETNIKLSQPLKEAIENYFLLLSFKDFPSK